MPNYATKSDLTSNFAKNTDFSNLIFDVDELDTDKFKNVPSGLSNLKIKLDKLDIGKLEITAVDFSELSNVRRNDVVKKTKYNKLVKLLIRLLILVI